MNISKSRILILALVVAAMASGCAQMSITGAADVNKEAFGPKKKFAVVSISSPKTFRGEQGLLQRFKNNDDIPGVNTQPIINKLHPKIIRALGGSRNITLIPEAKVLASSAYKNATEDPRLIKMFFISDQINVANNYKYISDAQNFAKLARDLNVDGVIGVTASFSVASGGSAFHINGLSFGKKSYYAMAIVSAIAYDRNGDVIWKDSTIKEAEPGDTKAIIAFDTTDFTGTAFMKLHPSAVEIGGKAVDVLLARLDDTMAGKPVERIQRIK
ncbi:MAG: hypothetical protein ACYC5S_09595 [Thiobacillus sp.]